MILITLLVLMIASSLTKGSESHLKADAATRAFQTLEGLFNYYWKSDPQATNVKFLFVCGQVGGWGSPHSESECSCDHPKSCVNCYRWYDAIALESLATYGIYTQSKNHSDIAETIYDHSPYNGDWNATAACTYIDDFTWYGIAYLRVYEWLMDPKWLNRSLSLYEWAWEYGWDKECGGFWWNNCDSFQFKDSITIVEMLHFSTKLAYMFPNQSQYLNDSMKIWNWFFSFDGGHGLISDKYLVSTGAVPEKCCNSTSDSYNRCYNTRLSGTSYNQGLLMSASSYLYLRTGNVSYLKTGLRLFLAIKENYTTSEGVLIDEPRSYQSFEGSCWAGADPGGDWYSFNGIFMLHLGYFTDLLSQNKHLDSSTLSSIKSLIDKTSDAAWTKSAVWPPFGGEIDGCDIGVQPVNSSAKYPKFHWWWGKDETLQMIPPDPRFFFHRRKLSCVANKGSSSLWKGNTKDEDTCMKNCKSNEHCSKYQFKSTNTKSTFSSPVINCWLWSFNRSEYSCRHKDDNYNIGIKRPVGNATTCASKCGMKVPQSIDHGVCYCDDSCAFYMDCCLDYADHCRPAEPILCKGNCTDVTPRPIPQGGYCWCFDGCNGWFTDNNSDGSCCSDYPQECMQFGDIPMCLDARSQGSALNLFLAQLKVSTIN